MTKHNINRRAFLTGVVAVAAAGPVIAQSQPLVFYGIDMASSPDRLCCIVYDAKGNILAFADKVITSIIDVGTAKFELPDEIKIENWEEKPESLKIAIVKNGQELAFMQSPILNNGDSLRITGMSLTIV